MLACLLTIHRSTNSSYITSIITLITMRMLSLEWWIKAGWPAWMPSNSISSSCIICNSSSNNASSFNSSTNMSFLLPNLKRACEYREQPVPPRHRRSTRLSLTLSNNSSSITRIYSSSNNSNGMRNNYSSSNNSLYRSLPPSTTTSTA